jgi:hypothetical protein
MTRAFDVDLLRTPRRTRWLTWLLVASAFWLATDTFVHYRSLKLHVADKSAQLAALPGPSSRLQKPDRAPEPQEYKFARETVAKLSTPWDVLFESLEASRIDDLALTEIDPDPANGTVVLSGEAKDYLTVLTYVARLADQPGLRSVRLARHEDGGEKKGFLFAISARWREAT